MDDGLDSIWIALAQLKLERANLLAERCRLLQERGGGWWTSFAYRKTCGLTCLLRATMTRESRRS